MSTSVNSVLAPSSFKSSLVTVLIAFLLFFSVATTLRPEGFPVGVSEIIAAFLILVFAFRSHLKFITINPVVIFWLCFIPVVLLAGLLNTSTPMDKHTLVAYFYDIVVVFLFSYLFKNLDRERLKSGVWIAMLICMAILAFGFLIFLTRHDDIINFFRVHAYGPRYAGWSLNPNQLAIFMLPMPFLCIAFFKKFKNFFVYLIFTFLALLIGTFVRSDALVYTWCFTLILFPIFGLIFKMPYNKKAYWGCAGIYLALMLLFQVFLNGVGNKLLNDMFPTTEVQYKHQFSQATSPLGVGLDENKVGVRRTLWLNAFEAWKENPILGKGPGAHSYYKDPTAKLEAHNIYLDMADQSGLVGLFIFLGLFLYLGISSLKNKDIISTLIILSVAMFSGAHFTLRQPVFSIFLLLCFYCSQKKVWNES